MSRKPTIKLSYPDASTLAMQLTDAMIRRAPGKRVLETTSEDKSGDGEGSLLDNLNSVRTSTGVEMTLTLEPSSMDYALQQLIRPNLTEEEKKSIFGETENELKLETLNGEQEKTETAINITCMLAALLDCIQREKAKTVDGERELCTSIVNHIRGLKQDFCFSANEIAGIMEISAKLWFENDYKCPGGAPIFLSNMLYHTIRHDAADKYNKTCNDCDHYDPADGICEIDKQEKDFLFPACDNFTPETDTIKESQRGEIDSGLLNDLDDGSDGMAPAEEVMGHDE